MAWKCSCGLVNGGTNKFCPGALTWKSIEHKQVTANSPDWVMSYLVAKELGMTPQEELFAKFYNQEKLLVKDMDHVTFQEHRNGLQKIAFEARAKLSAADDENKERKAKVSNKEWLVSSTSSVVGEYDVTNAINVVQKRAARMSKMDKLREQLQKAGIDEETIREMVSNLEKKATDGKLKTVTFTKPTVDISAIQVSTEKVEKSTTPFDPASLSFACKVCKQNPCRCDGLTPVLK
jgi:hypothetical protein